MSLDSENVDFENLDSVGRDFQNLNSENLNSERLNSEDLNSENAADSVVLDSEISESKKLVLSSLPKTYLIDIDGTIAKHNGYLETGDELLAGVKEFWAQIRECDRVILLTARSADFAAQTQDFLKSNGLRFEQIIYGLPLGERILINDNKPSGLKMAFAVNKARDCALDLRICVDENL